MSAAELHARLSVAEETLRAIRNGEVDALVVRNGVPAAQVFTLSSADRPYRLFVENMRDGAATVSDAGTILYANRRLAELVSRPLKQIIGSSVGSLLATGDDSGLLAVAGPNRATIEAELIDSTGRKIPVRVNTSRLDVDAHDLLCVTFADLTEPNDQKLQIERLGQAQAERMRELEAAQTALIEQATHDSLTGLPNRNLLIDRLAQALALAERSGQRDRSGLCRPGQLQGVQRHRGACRGGFGAAPDRPAAAQRGASDGQRGPTWRRRIRRAPAGFGELR